MLPYALQTFVLGSLRDMYWVCKPSRKIYEVKLRSIEILMKLTESVPSRASKGVELWTSQIVVESLSYRSENLVENLTTTNYYPVNM